MVQMHQKEQLGGGTANDKVYTTWEIKECPKCGRLVREYYTAEVLDSKRFEKIKRIHHIRDQERKVSMIVCEDEDLHHNSFEDIIE